MKVMFLVPSREPHAHTRFRVLPLVEWGRENGIDVSYKMVPRSFFGRYAFFSRLPHVDVFVVHRELFSSLEIASLRRLCSHLIYDFSDSAWTLPRREQDCFGSSGKLAKILRRFERVAAEADLCIVDNLVLQERLRGLQEQVCIVPTPIDSDRYVLGDGGKIGGTLIVGWMGDCENEPALPETLDRLRQHYGVMQFSVVSHRQYKGPGQDVVMWSRLSESMEATQLQAMDIGLAPCVDDEYSRGISGVNVLRYMAAGVPVVASGSGGIHEIIEHGVDGFLVNEPSDWERYVIQLVKDPSLRQRFVKAARDKVVRLYDTRVLSPKYWENIFSLMQ